MMRRRTDYILYAALTLGTFASLAGGVLLLSPHVALLGTAICAAAALAIKFGDWVIPALVSSSGAHPVYDVLELVDDAAVFKEEGEWVAAGFVIMEITTSPLEEGEKQQLTYLSQLSNFYTYLPDETVISMYLSPVDIDGYRNRLRLKYHTVLQDLQSAQRDGKAALERQLKMKLQELERQLESLETDRPLDVAFVAKVAARAPSREAALRLMRERRSRLESAIRGVLRVATRVARGSELVDVMRITMTLPRKALL